MLWKETYGTASGKTGNAILDKWQTEHRAQSKRLCEHILPPCFSTHPPYSLLNEFPHLLSDGVIILSGRPVIPIIDFLLEPKHIKNAGGPDYMFARKARSWGGGAVNGQE